MGHDAAASAASVWSPNIIVPRHRAETLQVAGAEAAVVHLWLPRSGWGQLHAATDPFALGVASGSPRHDGVVLWTRLLAPAGTAAVTVQWEVAHDEAFARIAGRGQAQALPELAHAVHVEVPGAGAGPCVLLPLHGGRCHQPGGPHAHHAGARRAPCSACG
jgi:hypothetical protein